MKRSIILSNLGSCSDRYVTEGYDAPVSLKELFQQLKKLKGVDGVELVGTWHIRPNNTQEIKSMLEEVGLPVVSIIPDHFGTKYWGKGAFTAPDAAVRQEAIDSTLRICETAHALSCPVISIWNGQDGFDYPLQADYAALNEYLIQGLYAVASREPDLMFALEYKPKEPRNHCSIPNVYSALYLAEKTGLPNVGVTVDFGHSLLAGENVSDAICVAHKHHRLAHIHINDNFRMWDDDLITGSVHTIEYLELFYWLQKIGYQGYLSIDQYPYREDSLQAAQQSLDWMTMLERTASRIDPEKMDAILKDQDAVASTRYIREILLGA